MFKVNAYEAWRQEMQMRKLITCCSGLDKQLGGGIKLGQITEFCGGPGTGKTQFCLQLCVTVQIPNDCGGLGGKAIFIDTNQDFSPERLKEISELMSTRFQRVFHDEPTKEAFNLENLLNRISYVYCPNYVKFMAHITILKNTLKKDNEAKLIVIDSLASLVRQIDDDISERTRVIYEILTELHILAVELELAIVVTNELTTRTNGNDWFIHPALGNTFLHKINHRILLSTSIDKDIHYALVDKSIESKKAAIPFEIKINGVRSIKMKSDQ